MIDERTLLDGKELARLAREHNVPVEKFVSDLGTLYRSRGYEQDQSGEWNLVKPSPTAKAQGQPMGMPGVPPGVPGGPMPDLVSPIVSYAKGELGALREATTPIQDIPLAARIGAMAFGPLGQLATTPTLPEAGREAMGMVRELGRGPFGSMLNPIIMPTVEALAQRKAVSEAVEASGLTPPRDMSPLLRAASMVSPAVAMATTPIGQGLIKPFIHPGQSFKEAPITTAMMLTPAVKGIPKVGKVMKAGGLKALGGVEANVAAQREFALKQPIEALAKDLEPIHAQAIAGKARVTIAGVDAAGAGSANALYEHPELLKQAVSKWGVPEGFDLTLPLKEQARAATSAMLEHQGRVLKDAFAGTKTRIVRSGLAADEYVIVSDLPIEDVNFRIELAKGQMPTLEIPSIKKGAETVVAGQMTHNTIDASKYANPKTALDVALNIEKRQHARSETPPRVVSKPTAEPVRITTEPPASAVESGVPVLSATSRASVRNVPGMGRVVRLQPGQPTLAPLTTPSEALPGKMLEPGIPKRVGGELTFPSEPLPTVSTPSGLVGGRTIELTTKPLTQSEMVNAAIERKLAGERSARSQMTRGGMERRSLEPAPPPASPQLRPGRIQSRMLGREAVIIGGRPVVGANIGDIGNSIIQSPELLAEAKNIVKSGGKLETGFVNAEGKFTSSPWEPHTANNLETIVALAKERGVSTIPTPGAEALPGKPPALPKPSAEPVGPPAAPVEAPKATVAGKAPQFAGGEGGISLNPIEAIRSAQNALTHLGEEGAWGKTVQKGEMAVRSGFSKWVDPVKNPLIYEWLDSHRGLGLTKMPELFRKTKLAEEIDPVFGKQLGIKYAHRILDIPETWHPDIAKAIQDIADPIRLSKAPKEVLDIINDLRGDFAKIWDVRGVVKAGEYGEKAFHKAEQLGIKGAGEQVKSLIENKQWDTLESEWGLDSPSRAHSFVEMSESGLKGYGGKRTYEFWRVKRGSSDAKFILDSWSKNSRLVAPEGIRYPEKIMNEKGVEVQEWITLPKDKRLGALSGRQVKAFLEDKIDHLTEPGFQFLSVKKPRLTKTYRRTEIPEEYRDEVLLQTKNPVLPIMQAMQETAHNIAYGKLFNELAYNPDYTKWITDNRQAGFRLLPETAQLGPLSGKWVHPGLHEYLMRTQAQAPGAFQYYLKALNAWRWMKTVGSLPTQARNVMSNFILADMAGLSPWRMDIYAKALRDLSDLSPMFHEATKSGALEGRFVGEYIKPLIKEADPMIKSGKFKSIMDLFIDIPQKAYQGAEQVSKMALYRYFRDELKYSPEKSGDLARNAIFDYAEVPRFISEIRNVPIIGRPFAIFPFKAIPRIAKQAIKHPIRFAKYPAAIYGIEEIARHHLGYNKEDWESMKQIMPTYMQSGRVSKWVSPNYIPLPMRDKGGNIEWLNTGYILPWGQTEQYIGGQPSYYAEEAKRGTRVFPEWLSSQEPIFNLASDLTTNMDWLGRPIVGPGVTGLDKAATIGKYVSKQLAPTTIPPLDILGGLAERVIPGIDKYLPYGSTGEKIARSISGRPDYKGQKLTPIQGFTETIGVKTVPTNEIAELRRVLLQYKGAYNKINDDLTQIMYSRTLTTEEKQKRVSELKRNREQLVSEYKSRIGDNPYLQTVIEQLRNSPIPTTPR